MDSVRTPDDPDHAARLEAAITNIRVDGATAEVLRALDTAGIDVLLLKGPALRDWYATNPPAYNDCDLWVAPGDVRATEETLTGMGFAALLDAGQMPDWWQEHASTWGRRQDGAVVDLHRTLQGIQVEPSEAWDVLSQRTEPVLVAGHQGRRLSEEGRAFYVTVHAAHHGQIWSKALSHLRAALAALDDAAWRDALKLARRLDSVDAFAAGLRLLPEGAELAERMGLPKMNSMGVALQAASAPPVARGFEQLSAATWPRRAAIVARKLVPPPTFIRLWWPPAARNRAWLLLGYVYRPVWLLRHAPGGWRAWRNARRSLREPPPSASNRS